MPPKARGGGGGKATRRPVSPDPTMSPTMSRYFDSQSTDSGGSSGSDTESTGSSGSTGTRDSSVSGSSFRSGSEYSSSDYSSSEHSSDYSSSDYSSSYSGTYSEASTRTDSTGTTASTAGEGADRRRKWGKKFKRLAEQQRQSGSDDDGTEPDAEPQPGRRADWFNRRGAKVDKVVDNLAKRFDIPGAEPEQLLLGSGLPPAWQSLQDEATGNTYYWNTTTNETTWERPQLSEPKPGPGPGPEPEPEPEPEDSDPVLGLKVDADWPVLWEQLANLGWRRAEAPKKAEGVGWKAAQDFYYIPPATGRFQMLTSAQLHANGSGSGGGPPAKPRSAWVANGQSMPPDGWTDLDRERSTAAVTAAATAGVTAAAAAAAAAGAGAAAGSRAAEQVGIRRDYYDTPEQVVAYVTQLQAEIRALPAEVSVEDPLAPSSSLFQQGHARSTATSGTSSAIVTTGGSSQTDSLSFLLEQRDGSGNPTHSSSALGSSARRRNIALAPEAADEWSRCSGSLVTDALEPCRVQGEGTHFLREIQPGDLIRVTPKIELVTFEETALGHQDREVVTVWSDTELDVRKPFSLLLDGSLSFRVRRVAPGTRVGGYFSGSNPQAIDFVRDLEAAERVAAEEAEKEALLAQATADYHELERQRRLADPSTPEYLMQQGNVAFRKKDFEAAEASFSAALRCDVGKDGYGIELATSPHLIYCNRSAARLRLQKKALALRDAKTACKLAPQQPVAFYRAAKAHASLSRWEDATEALETAARQLQPPPGHTADRESEEEDEEEQGAESVLEVKAIENRSSEAEAAATLDEPTAPQEKVTANEAETEQKEKEPETAGAGPAVSAGLLALRDMLGDDDEEEEEEKGEDEKKEKEQKTKDDKDEKDSENMFGTDTETESESESGEEEDDKKEAAKDAAEDLTAQSEISDDDDDDTASTASTGTESTGTESTGSVSTGSVSTGASSAASTATSRSSRSATTASSRSTAASSSHSAATTSTRISSSSAGGSSSAASSYKETRIRLAWGRGTDPISDDALATRILALVEGITPRLAAFRRKGEEGDPLNPNYKPPRGVGPGMVPPPPPPGLLVEVPGWKEDVNGKVVYTARAECESGLVVSADHRYSSLEALNKKLEVILMTANTDGPPPAFPPKSFFGGGGSDVAEGRRYQLNQWLPAIVSLAADCDGDLEGLVMEHLFGASYDSLTQHIPVLKEEGYDDVSLLRDATVGDLEDLGIHRVHAEEIIGYGALSTVLSCTALHRVHCIS
jgi:tetratricopeptide (TPR) repeat protein